MSNNSETFSQGIIRNNPLFTLLLGMCPSLAVTTSLQNGIGIGLATTFVLLGSNISIALLKNVIPAQVRIPSFIIVIATFVTIVDMILHAFSPVLYNALGIFIPLIVVNCIILGRAEAFASKNTVFSSMLDALGMGLGFTLAVALLAFFREVLGSGSVTLWEGISYKLPDFFKPGIIFILPPGAFITLGFIIATTSKLRRKFGL